MPFKPVDTALKIIVGPAIDDTDFKTREEALTYDQAGMEVDVILEKHDGTIVTTAVTPTTAGDYDWVHTDQGYYSLELTASGGASFNNTEEGIITVAVYCTGVLPFRSISYDVVPTMVYNSLVKGTDKLEVDTAEISGDSTAANNLEATYDGTGYTEDSAPATQEQVGRLTSGTAAINTTAESFTKSGAEPETNTYASTIALDGTYHIVEDIVATGVTDAYYQFDVGGDGTPVSITWQGYAQSQGGSYGIYAYNYGTTTYEQIGTISAKNITTLVENTYALTTAHVGTGANKGKVRFRFLSADGTAFATDRILCSYAIVVKTAGYSDGAIWINTLNSNTNTEDYVDGTSDNPVSTWAAAKTLSASLDIDKFHVVNGSTLTMDASCDNFTFIGHEWTIALGGQSFENTHIEEATVSGTGTAGSGVIHFRRCFIGGVTLGKSKFNSCGFNGTNTASAASTYVFDRCYNAADGSTPPVFDFGGAIGSTHGAFRNWQGGIEVANVGANGTDVFTVTGRGRVVIASTCSGGTIKIIGDFTVTDNVVGGFLGTLSEDARYDIDQINEQVDLALNTAIPGSPVTNSINEVIDRILTATEIRQSSINDPGGAATTTKFITALTETDNDFWNRMAILFTSGNNSGQMRRIKDYDGGSKEITLQTPLNAIPANADTFIILTVRAFITPDIEDIADAVLDELTADHTGAGSLSKAISDTLADTGELQTDWVNGGRLDLLLDACALEATLAALNNISAADVNAQVVDVMKTDTTSEMSQGAPPATPTFEEMVAYLYFRLRNKRETTASEDAIYDNAGTTKLFKSTISDDATTFTKAEYGSGA